MSYLELKTTKAQLDQKDTFDHIKKSFSRRTIPFNLFIFLSFLFLGLGLWGCDGFGVAMVLGGVAMLLIHELWQSDSPPCKHHNDVTMAL